MNHLETIRRTDNCTSTYITALLISYLLVFGQSVTAAGSIPTQKPFSLETETPLPSPTLVFIDTAVADFDHLLNTIQVQSEIYLLNRQSDGVQQIAAALAKRHHVKTVVILAHGNTGEIHLGNTTLDSTGVEKTYRREMETIGRALANGADLLLYSCNTGRGASGRRFVEALASATGADVAASDDLTGASALGGDWILETTRGSVDLGALHTADVGFRGVLAITSENFDSAPLNIQNGVTTYVVNDWTFTSGTATQMAVPLNSDFNVLTNQDGGGSDRTMVVNSTGVFGITTMAMKSTDGTNFQLNSFDIGNIFDANADTSVTIAAYRDGNPVSGSTELVDLTTSDSAGNITYTQLYNFNGAWAGTVSFNSVFQNVDEIRFTYTTNGALEVDNISISAAVANTAPALGGTFTTAGTVNDNATTSPFNSVTVSDLDGDNVSVSITYTSANGTLSGTGVTGSAGSYSVTSAAPATATSNLQGITFTPTTNQVAPGSTVVTAFTLTPNDGTTDGTSDSTTQITATSINDAPVITSNGGAATGSTAINENNTAVTTVTSSDVDTGETYTYSISGGVDQALFNINSSNGILTFAAAPDYESPADSGTNNVYDVQVTVTDSGTGNLTDTQDLAVTVNNINENPVITSDGGSSNASINAAENQTAVTTVTAIDQDSTDTLTYSISGGVDQALFSINGSSGALVFASAPNYESPTDSGSDGVYDVQVTVTDNGAGSLTDVQAIAVTVTNVNDPPDITSNGGGPTASTSVNENTTAVTTVTATDADASDTLTYSISGGVDSALFSINSSSGALVFASAPDYESPTDSGSDNIYDVQVTVTDNGTGSLTDTQSIAVTVNNANEAPNITSNGGGPTAATSISENTTAVTTVTATDADAGDTLTYSISGGVDSALFSINSSSGVLVFTSAPDYESPADSGSDNIYEVQVTVTDNGTGSLTDVQTIAITVTDATNEAPVITSNGGGPTAATGIDENSTAVTTVTATDADAGDTLTYSISGGADSALFSINSSSGALAFASAPDYESPADSGSDNTYDVQVTVTDNGAGPLADTQTIAVTVNDTNEAPTISSTAPTSASENTLYSYTLAADDQDSGDTLSFSALTLPSWLSFNAITGVLSGTPDSSSTGSHNVQLRVSDGTLNTDQSFSITVNGTNHAPVVTGTPVTRAIVGVVYSFTIRATDADVGDSLNYVIAGNPSWLSINAATGVVSGTPGLNDLGIHSGIQVGASDGTHSTYLAAFSITVISDLDGDGISDDLDDDIDGDGMSNDYEDANGLDKFDASDRDGDLDGDGVSNYDEFVASTNANADDYPPVITLPDDVTVDATGLFTAVDIGAATAVDGLDGAVTVTSDSSTYFTPGAHIVTWSATDAANNNTTANQTVNVIPLVGLSKDQDATEGSSSTFKVILNGPAVSYPVLVPYTLSGTADNSDHDLVDGTATITAPGLETAITVNLVNDGPGEGRETLIVTLGTPSNAVLGPKSTHTLSIHEGNVAPTVTLSASQGSTATRLVQHNGANVVVTASVTDPNQNDIHIYDWSASDNALLDLDTADSTFTFAPETIGTYGLRLTVTDSGGLSNSASLTLNVFAALPALGSDDTDGDNIDDTTEGSGDDDGDGIPNYLDNANLQRNTLQEFWATANEFVIETEPGLALQLGSVAFRTGSGGSYVTDDEVATHGNEGSGAVADSDYSYAGGLFDFAIEDLPVSGQSVNIVLPQQSAIPPNALYRKLLHFGWVDFVEDNNNHLMSATGSEGYCPPPGDSSFSPGLNEGDWCVQLTIEDGGPNDADGETNRHIEDPGGVATLKSTTTTSGGGGGGGSTDLWVLLLLTALAIAFGWRPLYPQRCRSYARIRRED